jgi:hypothetical protein
MPPLLLAAWLPLRREFDAHHPLQYHSLQLLWNDHRVVNTNERLDFLITTARERAVALELGSPTRAVATDDWLGSLDPSDALRGEGGSLPPLLLHLARLTLDQLHAVDTDIRLVLESAPRPGEVGRFLTFGRSTARDDVRQWYSGRVELAVQAHLLACLGTEMVQIEPELPNRRLADAAIYLAGRRIWVECTALSAANVDQDEFVASPESAKWGDPYQDALRIYRAAFDKIAGLPGPVDEMRGQLHPSEASILVIADAAWQTPGFDSLGAEWAVGQLTDPVQRADRSRASLELWASDRYRDKESVEIAFGRLSHLSALAEMSYDLRHLGVHTNKGCDSEHLLSSEDVQGLTKVLNVERPWL